VLEHQGQSPKVTELALGQAGHIAALEEDLTAGDEPGRGDQPHDRQRGHALAGPGFAHDADAGTGWDLEADAVDGPDQSGTGLEMRLQILDLEENVGPLRRFPGLGTDIGAHGDPIFSDGVFTPGRLTRCRSRTSKLAWARSRVPSSIS
jgi:hypothetical protein